MVRCMIKSHHQHYKPHSLSMNEDAEGMCTSVASLEPDPRYSGCCSHMFRPGRVVRDMVVGSLVVLAVAVVIAVVFVVCFFFVPGKCRPRQLEMCSDLPHGLTASPNWAGDQTDEDLHQTSLPFMRDVIVRSRCSPRAKEYSCAILEPPCTPEGAILPPCRTFCKSVAATCQEFINSRFSLSSAFDCEQFPDSSDPSVCFDMTSDSVPADNTTSVTPAAEEAEGTEPTLQETTTLPQEFETATATTCPELQCLDGTCISLSQVNDGVLDCPEGIDEEDFGGLI